MNPKMTIIDAAHCLGRSQAWVYSRLLELGLSVHHDGQELYFNHHAAAKFFQFRFAPKVVVFQVLKGGTGKTSLAFELAIRAHLYGAEVLCIDLDSQGNLTQAFNKNAEEIPVMIDHLVEGYPIYDSLMSVSPGLDLLPSRIENALLDEVIRENHFPLEKVYQRSFNSLKTFYDLIVVDCPPSLGQSVAAAALAADILVAPVTPDKYALSGLESTLRTVEELEQTYSVSIPFYALLNKFEPDNARSFAALNFLKEEPQYQNKLLPTCVRLSSSFPEASSAITSIFESVEFNTGKEDIDLLTQSLLEIESVGTHQNDGEARQFTSGLSFERHSKLPEDTNV